MILGPPHQEIALTGGSTQGFEITALCLRWSEVISIAEGATAKPLQDFGSIHARFITDPGIEAMILRLWGMVCEGDPLAKLYADGVVITLVATLLKLAEAPIKPRTGGLASWQTHRVTELMQDRMSEDLSLTELAGTVGLSQYHFSRAFKKAVGVTPHHHQIQLRMHRAKTHWQRPI